MKYLNHSELEAIAFKILDKYRELPEVKNSTIYRVEPELLLSKVLNLKLIHTHLSLDNSILGMTAKTNALVEVFEEDNTSIAIMQLDYNMRKKVIDKVKSYNAFLIIMDTDKENIELAQKYIKKVKTKNNILIVLVLILMYLYLKLI